MNLETRVVRRAGFGKVEQIKSAKDWTLDGDEAKKRLYFEKAIGCYAKAFETASMTQKVYLVPRVMACYRKLGNPTQAKTFFIEMKNRYGSGILDRASYIVMAAVHGDLKEWDMALQCANQACILNEGVIDQYLDAVYGRINYNI